MFGPGRPYQPSLLFVVMEREPTPFVERLKVLQSGCYRLEQAPFLLAKLGKAIHGSKGYVGSFTIFIQYKKWHQIFVFISKKILKNF